MTNYEKLCELHHLANRALQTHHYARAEKLLQQMLEEAFSTGNHKTIYVVSKTFLTFRCLRALEVLEILKRIDPIQAKRKVLS